MKLAREDRQKFPLYKRYYSAAIFANEKVFDANVVPTQEDNVNTYILACRDHFKVLEESDRRKKRLGLQGKIGYVSSKNKRKREEGNDNGNAKRSRGEYLRCSDAEPIRPGKRKKTCRLCGYAITVRARQFKLECCDKYVHSDCFSSSSELSASESEFLIKECSKLKHLIEKDKRTVVKDLWPCSTALSMPADAPGTPRTSRSSISQRPRASGGVPQVPCRYGCGLMIPISNSRHYLHECEAINRVFDPGGSNLTPISLLARRCAGMTRVRPLSRHQIPGP